jgi:hypothetical protein
VQKNCQGQIYLIGRYFDKGDVAGHNKYGGAVMTLRTRSLTVEERAFLADVEALFRRDEVSAIERIPWLRNNYS